jgi:sugar lactone lactonase YvrE
MRASLVCATCAAVVAVATTAGAWEEGEEFRLPGPFSIDRGIGSATPATAVPAYATSSRIAALEPGALVIDADSGWLVRTDAAGAPLAHVAIGTDAGTLSYDPTAHRAYVVDRAGDRVVVVTVGATLAIAATWKTPAEPYGIALTPDRRTAIVTTIADRAAVAFDVETGRERWRVALDAEPRGIAISGDGAHAAVASLATAGIGVIDLARHRLDRHAVAVPATETVARGAFSVTYLGDHMVAAAEQTERPTSSDGVDGSYGGGRAPPITHVIAFVDDRGAAATAVTNVNEPRAIAWDPARDALYLAGMASDTLIQIVRGSQLDPAAGRTVSLGTRCGADGLAVEADGGVLVWCSFPRAVVRIAAGAHKAVVGPELVASNLDAEKHQGMVQFHTADTDVSQFGALSCGNCHLDGRADGQSWLIHGEQLQTPMLAGRIAGTAPYKWDGTAKDLATSVRQTVTRLGGSGLSKHKIAAVAAYLESMPAVRTPTRELAAVARGKQLFDSAELGCTTCHDGPAYTDREVHALGRGKRALDTPSLIGLAASAPYFHDGSAATLDALLRDHGAVHGMATSAGALTDAQVADLRVFLETL